MLQQLAIDHNTDITRPYKELPEDFKKELIYGTGTRKAEVHLHQ